MFVRTGESEFPAAVEDAAALGIPLAVTVIISKYQKRKKTNTNWKGGSTT